MHVSKVYPQGHVSKSIELQILRVQTRQDRLTPPSQSQPSFCVAPTFPVRNFSNWVPPSYPNPYSSTCLSRDLLPPNTKLQTSWRRWPAAILIWQNYPPPVQQLYLLIKGDLVNSSVQFWETFPGCSSSNAWQFSSSRATHVTVGSYRTQTEPQVSFVYRRHCCRSCRVYESTQRGNQGFVLLTDQIGIRWFTWWAPDWLRRWKARVVPKRHRWSRSSTTRRSLSNRFTSVPNSTHLLRLWFSLFS